MSPVFILNIDFFLGLNFQSSIYWYQGNQLFLSLFRFLVFMNPQKILIIAT